MAKNVPTPKLTDAARAEKEGDFHRARALTQLLLTQAPHLAMDPGSNAGTQDARQRLKRLGVDPAAWLSGLLAMVLYGAVWVYALHANQ